MAERKKTPNILADLLGDSPQNTPTEQKTGSQQAVLPAKQHNGKTAIVPTTNDATEVSEQENTADDVATDEGATKIKVTFYLSEDSVDLLEEAQRTLRRMNRINGKTSKATTSKSALLEAALKFACTDLENHGEESQLASTLF